MATNHSKAHRAKKTAMTAFRKGKLSFSQLDRTNARANQTLGGKVQSVSTPAKRDVTPVSPLPAAPQKKGVLPPGLANYWASRKK